MSDKERCKHERNRADKLQDENRRLLESNKDYFDKYTMVQQWLHVERRQNEKLRAVLADLVEQVQQVQGLMFMESGEFDLSQALEVLS